MNFWTTSTGEDAKGFGNEFESAGGGIVIPDNSNVLAYVKDAGIDEYEGVKSYFIQWAVLKPEKVEGAYIRQKLYLIDPDPRVSDPAKQAKKRDTALRNLIAIDKNAGGKLSTLQGQPTDPEMKIALINKQMVIKVKEWEMNGNSGNWVAGIFPKTKEINLTGEVKAKSSTPKPTEDDWGSPSGGGFGDTSAWGEDLKDEIPF